MDKLNLEGELAVSSNLDKYLLFVLLGYLVVNGKNFIKTMLNVGKKYPQLKLLMIKLEHQHILMILLDY